jgi:hypothetical protein
LLGIKLDWSCGANGVKAGADPVCAVDPAEPGYQGFAVGPGDRDVTVAQCDGDLVEAFGHRQEELGGAARPFEQVEPMESCAQHHQSGVNELTVLEAARAQAADERSEPVDVAPCAADCFLTGGVHGAGLPVLPGEETRLHLV